MVNKIPSILTEKLKKLFLEQGLKVYNIYFREIEKNFGLKSAIDISLNVWKDFAAFDAKRISEIFQIPGANLEEILKLLDMASCFSGVRFKFDKKIGEDSAYLLAISCYWQKVMAKVNRNETIRCDEMELKALSSFLESINPEFEVLLDKSIPNGDEFCRYLIRKKKN